MPDTNAVPSDSINSHRAHSRYSILVRFVIAVVLICIVVGSAIWTNDNFAGLRQPDTDLVQCVGTVHARELAEISGMAVSLRYPNAFWVHNDSGHAAILYLISMQGKLLAKFPITCATNRDWEDICCFNHQGRNFVLIGDIGDNGAIGKSCRLYLFEEPQGKLIPGQVVEHAVDRCEEIEFTYPDGPRNCEAIGFDSSSLSVFLIEKVAGNVRSKSQPGVYAMSIAAWLDPQAKQRPSTTVVERVANFPVRNVTAMAFSDDTQKLIVRDYFHGHYFEREKDEDWKSCFRRSEPRSFVLPIERQGEAVCFSSDGGSIFVTSEFQGQPIWKVRLAEELLSRPDQ